MFRAITGARPTQGGSVVREHAEFRWRLVPPSRNEVLLRLFVRFAASLPARPATAMAGEPVVVQQEGWVWVPV